MADASAALRAIDGPDPRLLAYGDHAQRDVVGVGDEHTPSELRRAAAEDQRRGFLRTVSHELRTPLNAIIGFSEIIARELHGPINEPRYREHAEIIRDSGLQLLTLVNQIVDIARLEAGAMDLDLRPEPVREIAEEVMSAAGPAAGAKALALRVEVGAAIDQVLCDRKALRTVLGALLDNAVAFSPQGGEVTLRLRRLHSQVTFEIQDQGEGLDPGQIPRLMRPFEQGESALARRVAGAGLGLPTARLLTRAMGGRLRLFSRPGQGLTAIVRLPAAPTAPRPV